MIQMRRLMRVMGYSLAVIFILSVISACGSKENQSIQQPEDIVWIDVEVHTDPEVIEPGVPVSIQALVTQGEELVNDAEEVKFEIWEKGQEEHENLLGTLKGDGVYTIDKTFEDDGIYYVIAHVTARKMHHMPRVELTVGNVDPSKYEGIEEPEHDEHGHHDHH